MDIAEARALASEQLATLSKLLAPGRPLALFGDEGVVDHGWCFEFPWNTARYVETRNLADILGPGDGPIVVVKSTGDVWVMSSMPDPDIQLATYAAENGIEV